MSEKLMSGTGKLSPNKKFPQTTEGRVNLPSGGG